MLVAYAIDYNKNMPHSEPSPSAATPRRSSWRRLFQYRLRTLLILTTITAAWLAWWTHTARRQREAVAAFRTAGLIAKYDFQKGMSGADTPPFWPKSLVAWLGVDLSLIHI